MKELYSPAQLSNPKEAKEELLMCVRYEFASAYFRGEFAPPQVARQGDAAGRQPPR